jgi:hypothetical protein
MANVKPITQLEQLRGKVATGSDTSFRTRAGKTHTYKLQNPYKGPLAETRKAAIGTFREAVQQCALEMKDPERLAFWQKEFERYERRAKRRLFGKGEKHYSTVRGYIIAQLSARLRSEA